MSSVDDIDELIATRRLNGLEDNLFKKINIEDDIKRCEKLTEPQNANWIGISNQKAIAGVLARIKELEEENADLKINNNFKIVGRYGEITLEELIKNYYISVKKIEDKIEKQKNLKEELEKEYNNKHYEDDEIRARDFYMIVAEGLIIQKLAELLEDK